MMNFKNVLIGILALSIFLVGCNTTAEQSSIVLATVNGEDILFDDATQVQQSFMQQGMQITPEDALEQLINQVVLEQKVKEEGIKVSREEAQILIEAQLAQQGATLEDYKEQLTLQGLDYASELERIKDQLAIQNYLETILEGQSFEVSEDEAREFYELYKQQSTEDIPSYEELEEQIIATLKGQKQNEYINEFIEELKLEANIEYS